MRVMRGRIGVCACVLGQLFENQTGASTVEVQLTLNLRDFHAPDILSAVQANYHIEAPEPPSSAVVRHYDAIAENVMLLDIIYTFGHPVTNFFPRSWNAPS